MSFPMLQSALGALFFLIWFFIAVMMVGDRMAAIRQRRANDSASAGPEQAKVAPVRKSRRRARRTRIGRTARV